MTASSDDGENDNDGMVVVFNQAPEGMSSGSDSDESPPAEDEQDRESPPNDNDNEQPGIGSSLPQNTQGMGIHRRSSSSGHRELWEERTRKAFTKFFYPNRGGIEQSPSTDSLEQAEQDRLWVEHVWKTYDDIIFISLFTQLGMVFRLAAANWFAVFDSTFRTDSALFVNLPLNCLASFLMGFFSDGPTIMQIVETRFTPMQQYIQEEDMISPIGSAAAPVVDGLRRRRSQRAREPSNMWTTPKRVGDAEMREVQLLAYERRIRASPCPVLFPAKKQDVDVMDHYFESGYRRRRQQDAMISCYCSSQ